MISIILSTIIGIMFISLYIAYQKRLKLFYKIISKIMNKGKTKASVYEGITGKFLKIIYFNSGKEKVIYVPYDRTLRRKRIGKRVYLEIEKKEKDNTIIEKIDITQEAGIPYMLSAEEMGGNRLIQVEEDGSEIELTREIIRL